MDVLTYYFVRIDFKTYSSKYDVIAQYNYETVYEVFKEHFESKPPLGINKVWPT